MRNIKFRAWSKFSETMYEVREIRFNRETLLIRKDGLSSEKDFDEVELMQYTELHDKNGKEIYEGDIIRFSNTFNFFYEVFWSDEFHAFRLRNLETDLTYRIDKDFTKCKVIGNIYETVLTSLNLDKCDWLGCINEITRRNNKLKIIKEEKDEPR